MIKKLYIVLLLFFSIDLFGAINSNLKVGMRAEVLAKTELLFSIVPLDFINEDVNSESNETHINTTIMKYDFGQLYKGGSKISLTGRFLVTLTRGGQKVAFTNPPIATLQKGSIEANKIESEGKNASGDFVIPIEYDLVDFQKQATGEYIGRVKVTVDPEDSRVITGKFVDSTVGIKASVSGQMM